MKKFAVVAEYDGEPMALNQVEAEGADEAALIASLRMLAGTLVDGMIAPTWTSFVQIRKGVYEVRCDHGMGFRDVSTVSATEVSS